MMEKDIIQFGNTKIDYSIIYSDRRKNATLSVYPMKLVEISVPEGLERSEIQQLVRKKARWVIKQLSFFDQIDQIDSTKEYVNGETFLYLGRQYRLNVIKSGTKAEANLEGKSLVVNIPGKSNKEKAGKLIKAAVWQWYRNKAKQKVGNLIKVYSKKIGTDEPDFQIKNQYKRWGSCTSKNKLIFNLRIVMAPVYLIEYVIAHEMCHLKHRDHGTEFWKLLRAVIPDYEARKEQLRKEGWQFDL